MSAEQKNRIETNHLPCPSLLALMLAVALLGANAARAADAQIPESAKTLYARLVPALKPAVREWVSREAKKISKDSKAGEATVKADIQTRFAGQPLAGADVEALVFLVMMAATQDAQSDLKTIMAGVQSVNKQKAAQRAVVNKLHNEESASQSKTTATTTNLTARPGLIKPRANQSADSAKSDLDSKSELGETESLRLQMAMDRMSKMMQALSNIEKKISDTQTNIVSKLK